MRNKKGFTLIELLAIIVILAIIAVITIPIILNIVENSKKGAVINSAYGYKDAIGKFYVSKLIENPNFTMTDSIYSVGKLKRFGVSVSGSEPDTNSWVRLQNNDVLSGCLQFDEYKVEITDKVIGTAIKGECDDYSMRYTDSNEDGVISSGDYVKLGDDGFYVIAAPTDGKVKLLTEKGLCGNSNTQSYYQGNCSYKFSDTVYWMDSDTNSVYSKYSRDPFGYYYVYDENSVAYEYIEGYKNYLIGLGIDVFDARLMSYTEASATGCTGYENSCPTYMTDSGDFWLGSTNWRNYDYILYVSKWSTSGNLTSNQIKYYSEAFNRYEFYNYGIRSVFEVSESDLVAN